MKITAQIITAQIIRRFRDLEMPLDDIRAVLIRTRDAIASLRELLEHPSVTAPVEHRRVEATAAAAISEIVDIADALLWYQGALGELRAMMAAQEVPPTGSAGGMYANELFAQERGRATLFVPCGAPIRTMGRVTSLVVPAVELATVVHPGPHAGIDRAYGALASHVTRHALAVDGPIREYYLVDPSHTADETAWRTEIGWPVSRASALTAPPCPPARSTSRRCACRLPRPPWPRAPGRSL